MTEFSFLGELSKPVLNLYECLCSVEHKGRYFVTRLSMVPQNCSVSYILQNIFLCVQQDSRFVIVSYTVIQNITSSEM